MEMTRVDRNKQSVPDRKKDVQLDTKITRLYNLKEVFETGKGYKRKKPKRQVCPSK